jgi:ABC-type glutathione transport system ATPase component
LFAFHEGVGKGSKVEAEAEAEAEAAAEVEAEAEAEAEAEPEAEPEAEAWRVLELVGLRGRVEGLPERLHTDVVAADLSEVSKAASRTHWFTYYSLTYFLTITPLHLLTS